MSRGRALRWLSFVAAFAFAGCAGGPEEGASLYAAASLAVVLEGLTELHGEPIRTNFAASSVLAKQIAAGAPADLFVSANPAWTSWLAERGRLQGAPIALFGNTLVLVAPSDRPFEFDGRLALAAAFDGRLALADPEHVPLGVYAREALESAGWWKELERRVVGASDSRAALALVERAECAAGIVYRSDALGSTAVSVVWEIPEGWHEPVVYSAAIVRGGDTSAAARLLETLVSSRARAGFESRGFRVLSASAAGRSR